MVSAVQVQLSLDLSVPTAVSGSGDDDVTRENEMLPQKMETRVGSPQVNIGRESWWRLAWHPSLSLSHNNGTREVIDNGNADNNDSVLLLL